MSASRLIHGYAFCPVPCSANSVPRGKADIFRKGHHRGQTRLVFALGEIKVDAVAEDGQIHDDAEDIANDTGGFVGLFQQHIVYHKGEGN